MDYTIWLQILMELGLSVGGETKLDLLLNKACRAFHRKLDCTHIIILQESAGEFQTAYRSPDWVKTDVSFTMLALSSSQELIRDDGNYIYKEDKQHHYYTFKLKNYGSMVIGRGKAMSPKLVNELFPIMDSFATNILACLAFDYQIQVQQELKDKQLIIEHMAYHDSLTDLPNRPMFQEKLLNSLRANEYGAVILLDLDDFKSINDTLGHMFGDEVLIFISNKLNRFANESIFISRFGGDEFQILIRQKSRLEVESLIAQFYKRLCRVHNISGRDIDVSFSMGITMYPNDSNNATQLITNADLALYSVKNKEKRKHCYFNESLLKRLQEKINIENTLKQAIYDNQFHLVFQPIINANSGQTESFEALLRISGSSLPPSRFIPIAEQNNSMIAIGRIVTALAIRQLRQWIDQGLTVKPISLNYSTSQLKDLTYFSYTSEFLKLYKIPASLLEFEVSESLFINESDSLYDLLQNFHQAGHKISIDDFGLGYCSMNYLAQLPFDQVKFSRSLIMNISKPKYTALITQLIELIHTFDLKVVAKGVETYQQFQALQDFKCNSFQGYYFSRPVKGHKVSKILDVNDKLL